MITFKEFLKENSSCHSQFFSHVFFSKEDFNKPNLMLKEREVSEIVFMIYVPRGTGLEAKNVRKSTWLNPLVDGEEARKMMGKNIFCRL